METSLFTNISPDELKELLRSVVKECLEEPIRKNRNTDSNNQELLNVKQAAAYLHIQVATLYEKTCKRRIPHFKKGKKLYFRMEDLEKWLKEGKVRTREELESIAADHCMQRPIAHRKFRKG